MLKNTRVGDDTFSALLKCDGTAVTDSVLSQAVAASDDCLAVQQYGRSQYCLTLLENMWGDDVIFVFIKTYVEMSPQFFHLGGWTVNHMSNQNEKWIVHPPSLYFFR